jgi:hypothetical protein
VRTRAVLARRISTEQGVEKLLDQLSLDAIIIPASLPELVRHASLSQ